MARRGARRHRTGSSGQADPCAAPATGLPCGLRPRHRTRAYRRGGFKSIKQLRAYLSRAQNSDLRILTSTPLRHYANVKLQLYCIYTAKYILGISGGFFVKGLGKQRPRMTTAGSYASGEDGLDSLEFCEHDVGSCVSRDGRRRE